MWPAPSSIGIVPTNAPVIGSEALISLAAKLKLPSSVSPLNLTDTGRGRGTCRPTLPNSPDLFRAFSGIRRLALTVAGPLDMVRAPVRAAGRSPHAGNIWDATVFAAPAAPSTRSVKRLRRAIRSSTEPFHA